METQELTPQAIIERYVLLTPRGQAVQSFQEVARAHRERIEAALAEERAMSPLHREAGRILLGGKRNPEFTLEEGEEERSSQGELDPIVGHLTSLASAGEWTLATNATGALEAWIGGERPERDLFLRKGNSGPRTHQWAPNINGIGDARFLGDSPDPTQSFLGDRRLASVVNHLLGYGKDKAANAARPSIAGAIPTGEITREALLPKLRAYFKPYPLFGAPIGEPVRTAWREALDAAHAGALLVEGGESTFFIAPVLDRTNPRGASVWVLNLENNERAAVGIDSKLLEKNGEYLSIVGIEQDEKRLLVYTRSEWVDGAWQPRGIQIPFQLDKLRWTGEGEEVQAVQPRTQRVLTGESVKS